MIKMRGVLVLRNLTTFAMYYMSREGGLIKA
jgi:hypothetical protein